MTQARLTRREFLRDAGASVGAVGLGAMFASCARSVTAGSTFEAPTAGILNFANWPLYIDKKRLANGTVISPSLADFTKKRASRSTTVR